KVQPCSLPLNSSEISSLFSIVRYEMQRLESITLSGRMALVGHASMHFVQPPQRSVIGVRLYGSSILTNISARNTKEPSLRLISILFLPIQPSPAFAASVRSRRGAESTK